MSRTVRAGDELPHSLDAEAGLLACCILDGHATITRCAVERVHADSFYSPAHRAVFEALLALDARASAVDVILLCEELKNRGELDAVGGPAFVNELTNQVATTAHAVHFAQIVRGRHLQRRALRLFAGLSEQLEQPGCDVAAIAAECGRVVSELAAIANRSPTAQPLTVWAPSQFLAYTPDPKANLLGDGIVALEQWTSLVGVGGLGKTRLALWLAVCVICRIEWCGLPTSGGPLNVLILSTENGLRRWRRDLFGDADTGSRGMLSVLADSQRDLVDRHLRLLALTPDGNCDLNLANPAATASLSATLQAVQPGLVVFDPLADVVLGDENKAEDMLSTLRALRGIVRSSSPRAAVLLIHHARTGSANIAQAGDNFHAGNFGRGSKTLYSSVRAELQLAPADRDDPNRLVLCCGKMNDGTRFEPRGIIFNPDTFTYAVDVTFDLDAWRDNVAGKRQDVAVTIADVGAVMRELHTTGGEVATGAIVEPLRQRTGASAKTIQRRIKDAKIAGYLRDGNKRGTWRLGSKPFPR